MNKKSNIEILKLLKQYFIKHPDERFCQGLVNIGIIECHDLIANDPFYKPNENIINSIKKAELWK